MGKLMRQVFISYSRVDQALAKRLKDDLEKIRADVFLDTSDIRGGEPWRKRIFAAIKRADYFVVCLSPDAIRSDWVRREIVSADGQEKHIVPIIARDCVDQLDEHEETQWLKSRQMIDFREPYEQAFARLQEALRLEPIDPVGDLTEQDWRTLLRRIKETRCTPFIGPHACQVLPEKGKIAEDWAFEHGFPLRDCRDFTRVTQFIAVEHSPDFVRDSVVDHWEAIEQPDFRAPADIYGLLADLTLPIYVTTNYDSLMLHALRDKNREPRWSVCPWHDKIKAPDVFESEATPANPVVYHLCGSIEIPSSLVITEDDYLRFLANVPQSPDRLPPRIQDALTDTTLLFLGYSFTDWDFRASFHTVSSYLENSLQSTHIAVQLIPEEKEIAADQIRKAQEYLSKYFNKLDIRVFWGPCDEFISELRRRWDAPDDNDSGQ